MGCSACGQRYKRVKATASVQRTAIRPVSKTPPATPVKAQQEASTYIPPKIGYQITTPRAPVGGRLVSTEGDNDGTDV